MGGASSSPASALLPDDVVLEILLRVPPEPIYLLRVSLVCKKWRRLVRDPDFLREFRARHRHAAPLIGFFYPDGTFVPDRVAAEHFSPPRGRWRVYGSRHGRVLLSTSEHRREPELLVWDPMTGIGRWEPSSVLVGDEELYWPERHVEYHNLGSQYSPPRRVEIPDHRSQLFGYNFETNWLQHVRGLDISHEDPYDCLQVFKDGYGELGLAGVRGSRLHLFEPVIKDDEDIASWSEYKDLDLEALLPPSSPMALSPSASTAISTGEEETRRVR